MNKYIAPRKSENYAKSIHGPTSRSHQQMQSSDFSYRRTRLTREPMPAHSRFATYASSPPALPHESHTGYLQAPPQNSSAPAGTSSVVVSMTFSEKIAVATKFYSQCAYACHDRAHRSEHDCIYEVGWGDRHYYGAQTAVTTRITRLGL